MDRSLLLHHNKIKLLQFHLLCHPSHVIVCNQAHCLFDIFRMDGYNDRRQFYRTRTKSFGLKVSSPSWLFFFLLFERHFHICSYFFFTKALIFFEGFCVEDGVPWISTFQQLLKVNSLSFLSSSSWSSSAFFFFCFVNLSLWVEEKVKPFDFRRHIYYFSFLILVLCVQLLL